MFSHMNNKKNMFKVSNEHKLDDLVMGFLDHRNQITLVTNTTGHKIAIHT